MDLTEENKVYIDSLSYEQLLSEWRFSTSNNTWFHGDTGVYWGKRMAELRDNVDHVGISKSLGWGKR